MLLISLRYIADYAIIFTLRLIHIHTGFDAIDDGHDYLRHCTAITGLAIIFAAIIAIGH